MSTPVIDSQADKDFLLELYGFAERKARAAGGDTYIANINSQTHGGRALIVVAFGETADAVNAILMQAAVREDEIIKRPSASDFIS